MTVMPVWYNSSVKAIDYILVLYECERSRYIALTRALLGGGPKRPPPLYVS